MKDKKIPAIEFKHVYKRFPGIKTDAVNDITMDIYDGEFITILGSSGCGKTTLLKMVNRLYDYTGGDIRFYGKSIKEINEVDHRRNIGYVVQAGGLFPHKTVRDNIATVPKLLKWDKKRIETRVDELLDTIGLDAQDYRNRYPRSLSGGQQQRVGIARALAADPNVLLMDEPFGAIDAITRTALQAEVQRLQEKTKKTILFVTHDIQEAFKLGSRVIIMHEGKLQQYDTPDKIMLHPANEFVSKLVSADDPIVRMKVISLGAIMEKVHGEVDAQGIFKSETSPVEETLPIFLKDRSKVIYVENAAGEIAGMVSWNQIANIV